MKKIYSIRLIFAVFLAWLAFPSPVLADGVLAVPEVEQEYNQWCWAGSADGTLQYYGTTVSQCTMANYAWDRSDCCGSHSFNWSHTCNQANAMYGSSGSLSGILSNWGVNSNSRSSALAQSTVESEINAGRPFIMRFGWTSGGGHFLVGRGIQGNNVYYMDPWPGNGYTIQSYSSVVSASDHDWTHSLQITTDPSTTPSAEVSSLYSVNNAECGQSSSLWAKVKNTGSSALPSSARVYYYVSGPGMSEYVGSKSVSGLNPGNESWYSYSWSIPSSAQAGTYNYWARVWDTSTGEWLSEWSSSQSFSLTCGSSLSAEVSSLYSVNNAECGQSSSLWAKVKNTGTSTLPSSARVYYYVSGPGMSEYVGSISVSGLNSGSEAWYFYSWSIPSSAQAGTYHYWARVWDTSTGEWLSEWSSPQSFSLTCGSSTMAIIENLYPLSDVQTGQTSTLSAKVLNDGASSFPSGCRLWFYVAGSGFSEYVGSVDVSGQSAGTSRWYSLNWSVPSSLSEGDYNYWAAVFENSKMVSDWSSPQPFTISSSSSCFSEDFNDGTANGWTEDDSSSWSVESNWYKAYKSSPSSSSELMFSAYTGSSFSDGTLEVDLWHPKAQEMAQYVYLRATSNFDQNPNRGSGMGFGIDIANSKGPCFGVWKYINGSPYMIKGWTASSAINESATNHVKVVASGSSYDYYINDSLMYSFTDKSFSSGYIGLGGWTKSDHVEVFWFDNVRFCPNVNAVGLKEQDQAGFSKKNDLDSLTSIKDKDGDGAVDLR